jgi:putative spermidine/putrescine transport system substrate-binding protein
MDLLVPIDYSRFDNPDDLVEGGALEYGVVSIFYSTVVAFNTDVYPLGTNPESWADFWDTEKFPGRRGLYDYVVQTLEAAVMADGVPPEEVYPIDIDRAYAKLDELKEDLIWWTGGAQPAQLLVDNELDICAAWNGRIQAVKDEGAPVDLVWNQGMMEADHWVILKGTPHLELAQEFVAFASRPDTQAAMANLIPYGPVNTKAFDSISEEVAADLPTYGPNLEGQLVVDYEWWIDILDEQIERFEAWKLS